MIPRVYFSRCILIMLFSMFLCLFIWKKDEIERRDTLKNHTDDVNYWLEFIDFCKSANLKVFAYADAQMNTIPLSFELDDLKFKNCFQYFDIFLESQRTTVHAKKILYAHDKVSYIFENITCGIYEIIIQPWYNSWQPAKMIIRYPKLINMSSLDCINKFPESFTSELIAVGIKNEVVVILAITSVVSLAVCSGLIYYYCWPVRCKFKKESKFPDQKYDSPDTNDEIATNDIHLYMFHFYNEKLKKVAEIIKDFFMQSSYYKSVKVIESELAEILFNVNDWMNNVLDERGQDGSLKKIILIDAVGEYKEDEFEIENLIFSDFIEKLSNNSSRCLNDYDNLFVVQLHGSYSCCERLRNIVRRDRYNISDRVPDDLIDLCVNLCSGSQLNISEVEKNLKKLQLQHPVKYLGSVQNV